MYQTVVMSPTVINSFEKLKREDAINLIQKLYSETFILDSKRTIVQEYDDVFQRLPHAIKQAYSGLWEGIYSHHPPIDTDILLSPRKISEIEKLESEAQLANTRACDFTLANEITEIHKINLKNRYGYEGEISNIENYLKPIPSSCVRSPEILELKPGESFNWFAWMLKYIKDATSLRIEDGYIGSYLNYNFLGFILSKINHVIPIEIKTLSDKARQDSRDKANPIDDGYKIGEKINKLRVEFNLKNLTVNVVDLKSQLRDRWLETNRFTISLGHSFDAVGTDNKVIREAKITVNSKQ